MYIREPYIYMSLPRELTEAAWRKHVVELQQVQETYFKHGARAVFLVDASYMQIPPSPLLRHMIVEQRQGMNEKHTRHHGYPFSVAVAYVSSSQETKGALMAMNLFLRNNRDHEYFNDKTEAFNWLSDILIERDIITPRRITMCKDILLVENRND